MGIFAYRVYYDYMEVARSDPLPQTPKNDGEIAQALRNFKNDLEQCLPDKIPRVNVVPDPHSIKVVFETSLSEAETEELVERCLCGLHLSGRKLQEV